ncbi:growth arrest and DNA damage-inducible proteins-interacting protein 1 [Chelonus insularis]|uniref:growth arrest and DNA damage-inducible proteins-interacting protein 1 n=1 Tax=Chelonus insularis TaxID=460826 RepID=UPI00158C98EA|nr:growth arrest and DNA damage-inducible proteins-interacting protein 1 [Chelonus insularis]
MNVLTKSGRYFLRSSIYYEKVLAPTFTRHYAETEWKDELDLTSIEETPKYVDAISDEEKAEILRKRNKSCLNPEHRNILLGKKPYNQSIETFHDTITYKRKMLGRHGLEALDIPAGALWLTKDGIEDKLEYERVYNPYTLQEGWKILEEKRQKEAETIRLREEEIEANMKKRFTWEKELQNKLAKKAEALRAAQEKKERLVEEVRRKLGFAVDPKDSKFQEALEKMEAEEKKRRKELKKQERAAKILAMLLKQSQEVSTNIEQKTVDDKKEVESTDIKQKAEEVKDISSDKPESK